MLHIALSEILVIVVWCIVAQNVLINTPAHSGVFVNLLTSQNLNVQLSRWVYELQ